jgi:hypothetical protein
MGRTACLVCFISTVNDRNEKKKSSLLRLALVAGTQQTLSNLFWRLSISMPMIFKDITLLMISSLLCFENWQGLVSAFSKLACSLVLNFLHKRNETAYQGLAIIITIFGKIKVTKGVEVKRNT